MQTDADGRTAAIVLAAGEARRFGSPKLLLPFRDSTVLGSVVAALEDAGLDPIIVVAGSHTLPIAEAMSATSARVVRNPRPDGGMLSSIRVGLAVLPAELGRFLLALADQPRVASSHISHLLREHRRLGKGIAIPTHRGKRGHPVVFDAAYRQEILALPDTGVLRDLIHAHPDDIAEIECSSDAVLRDIDTRKQYQDELRRSLAEQ